MQGRFRFLRNLNSFYKLSQNNIWAQSNPGFPGSVKVVDPIIALRVRFFHTFTFVAIAALQRDRHLQLSYFINVTHIRKVNPTPPAGELKWAAALWPMDNMQICRQNLSGCFFGKTQKTLSKRDVFKPR
jgi:hypothetical protein